MDKRRVMGKPIERIDGPEKASGRAKYSTDIKLPNMLYGMLLTSPYAHAKVRSIDVSQAEKIPGVKGVTVIAGPGTELQWQGAEIAAVAAEREELALDAVRAIKVDYEVLNDHFVREEDFAKAQAAQKVQPSGEVVTGDPDQAFKEAEVVSEGEYGIPVLTHCCLESHGQTLAWNGEKMEYFPSTQNVSGIAGDLAKQLEIPAEQIHAHQDHMGGGFGSKFQSDRWAAEAAKLSKGAGGRPVRLHLDRRTELQIAGCRPSFFGKIKLGAKKDGTITAWDSTTWSTGGLGGGGLNAQLMPYVYREVPNRRINHSSIVTHTGGARAWRAPNHPQVSFLTCSAMDDLAAKLRLDPLELFIKNANYTARANVYVSQLKKAAEMVNWKSNWHQRGDSGTGPIKRGLGIGVGTWQGLGHNATCKATIHPDGGVEVELGSQDLGTGTRTIIKQVASESLGVPMKDIKLNIGDNRYPVAGASGGSTTVGGVSAATRKATLNALEKLFEAVAGGLGAPAAELEAVDGKIQVKGNPSKSMTWKEACRKIGVTPITATGENNNRFPGGLIDGGVGGVQIADVNVDVETGVVKINKIAVAQDCGLIINPKTAASQCYGAVIMSVCGALMEERVMDAQTGVFLNAEMEFYKLAGIKDIGDIEVHLDIVPEYDARGVIGLGEPPVVPGIAAIANAVTNAIGVRVPTIPLTPRRVLDALAANERRRS
ncbi:MAG: xanthine dehydrogenase family protein molybdopterin-binding subunit [Bryobacteraceae bacterium]|nr:xanthine dehydrogenase family protein molybdopterin-binding subunit [Bryobacteraceae bacterium]